MKQNATTYRFEDVLIRIVVNAIIEREIQRVVATGLNADILDVASARKVFAILSKQDKIRKKKK